MVSNWLHSGMIFFFFCHSYYFKIQKLNIFNKFYRKPGDPPERRQTHNRIFKFRRLVERGREVDVDQEFGLELHPSYENQTEISIEVYSSTAIDATYCDEPGMKKVG